MTNTDESIERQAPLLDFLPADDAPIPTSAQPARPRKGLKRIGVAVAGLAALAATGALYEAIDSQADAAADRPSDQLIDVGGHRLYLECEGTGVPAVVMDAGLGGSSLDWLLVRGELAKSSRVCTFDRAGMGHSEPGPLPRSPGRNAQELHRLLEAGGVPGPYILVGHSLAGKNARMFAAAYPGDVAGMVLVDARSERIDMAMSREQHDSMTSAIRGQGMLYAVARRLGLMRLVGGALLGSPLVPPDAATQLVLRESDPNALVATSDEGVARSDDDAVLAAAKLGDLPLTVIAASDSMSNNPGWPAAQEGMAALSNNGRLVVAPGSHAVQIDQPNVVIEATLSMLADIRKRH
jgi:pimeloyl-ACP methyl ester carboxylesterase